VASLAVASPASAPVMDLAAPVVPPPMPPRVDPAAPKSPMNARRNRVSSDFRPDALGGGSTEGTRW
jgi:hypothetical protein